MQPSSISTNGSHNDTPEQRLVADSGYQVYRHQPKQQGEEHVMRVVVIQCTLSNQSAQVRI